VPRVLRGHAPLPAPAPRRVRPERLLARISSLTGAEIAGRADTIELVHKLATIFYQLGKAYVLAGTDPDYLRMRVFEARSTSSRPRPAVAASSTAW
jgi:hypothetical protein